MVFGCQDITEIYLKVVINTKNGNGFWLNKFFLIFLCEFFFKRNSFKIFFLYNTCLAYFGFDSFFLYPVFA